jgi:hypothetical protein
MFHVELRVQRAETLRTTVHLAYPHVTVLSEGTKQLQKLVHGESIEKNVTHAHTLCVFMYPTIVARQRLGKNVTAKRIHAQQ